MKWSNLVENLIALHVDPTSTLHVKFSYHDFLLAEVNDAWVYYEKYNISGNHERDLGYEYDIETKWKYQKDLEFQLIYAYFDAGSFVRKNVADNNAQRLFLQLQYKFN